MRVSCQKFWWNKFLFQYEKKTSYLYFATISAGIKRLDWIGLSRKRIGQRASMYAR